MIREARETSKPGARGPLAVSFAVALVLALTFLAMNLQAPFGLHGVPTQLAVYCELMSQCWDETGFQETLGMPMLMPSGASVAERLPYVHHPAPGFWPNYLGRRLLGKSEAGYRFFPLLATLLASLALWGFVARAAGPLPALLAVVSLLALPLMQLFGSLPNSEPFTLLAGCGLIALYLVWRARPARWRLVLLCAYFVLGCQVDWQSYFFAPGLWLAELLVPRGERRLRSLLVLLPTGIVAFLLSLLHMWLAIGSLDVVRQQILEAASATQPSLAQDVEAVQVPPFFESQRAIVDQVFGHPLLLAALAVLVALLVSRRWRRERLTRLAVIFLVAGSCTIVLFNRQSVTHAYFWYQAGPGVALLLVQGWRLLAGLLARRWSPLLAAGMASVLLLALLGWQLHATWPTKREFEREGFAEIAAQLDALLVAHVGPDVCITSPEDDLRPVMLYSRLRWAPPGPWPEKVREIVAWRDGGHSAWRQVVVIVAESSRSRWPEFFAYLEGESRRRIAMAGALAFVF